MRSADEVYNLGQPIIAEWLRKTPRVFARKVVTVVDNGREVTVFAASLEEMGTSGALGRLHPLIREFITAGVHARQTDEVSAVIIMTADGEPSLSSLEWVSQLASHGVALPMLS